MLVSNGKDVSSYRFPQPPWYFMWHCFIIWSVYLEIKVSGAIFTFSFSIHVEPKDGLTCQQPGLLCPCGSGTAVLVLCLAMQQVLLLFCHSLQSCLWLQYHLWMSSSATGICMSPLVSGQPWNVSYDSMARCAHHVVLFFFISCAHIQCGMSMHDYCIDSNENVWNFVICVCPIIVSG